MRSETSKRWLAAAKILVENSKAIVSCPACGQDNLTVTDIPLKWDHPKIDRLLQCPACGAKNYILMKAPGT